MADRCGAARVVAAALPAEDQPIEPGQGATQAESDQDQERGECPVARGDAGEGGAEVLDMGEVALAQRGGRRGDLHGG